MENNFIGNILSHRLHMDKELESFSNIFVSSDTDKESAKTKFLMKTWYDGYLLSLYVGIKLNTRKKNLIKTDKSGRGWGSRKKQYLYLISLLLAKPEIQIELNLDSKENVKSSDMKSFSDSIKNICDEYAFGGLEFLKKEYEKDQSLFDDAFFIENISSILKK